ncbi:MAG: type II toxin-antitoxin system VapC family toxin [Acidobacteria bacterium]|nr:type II toxin-antitoxin system VapC family toxin [Acidobacteriota bacterium]
MKETLVDSSVLIDVLTRDETWFEWSSSILKVTADESSVVINPVIYSEVSTKFRRMEELDEVLPLALCRRDNIPYPVAFLAARAFVKCRPQGGSRISPLSEFYIGAHAEVAKFRVLTRDPRRIRRYFPTVELITP